MKDLDTVQLIILLPDKALPNRSRENDEAAAAALDILLNRGDAPRIHRNGLLFLTAKNDEIRALRNSVKTYLAWDSILNGERRIANLTGNRASQTVNSLRSAQRELYTSLVRAYRWAMAPSQENPQQADYTLSTFQTNAAETGDIVEGAFQKFIQEELLVDAISPIALVRVLERYVWSHQNYRDHIPIDKLWELMTGNVYLHRLRNRDVLLQCITQGVSESKFGYATGYDGKEYEGLCFGRSMSFTDVDSGLLVHPEMAQLIIKEGPPVIDPDHSPEVLPDNSSTIDPGVEPPPDPPPTAGPKRIVVTKTIQDDISLDAIDLLRDEIIRNLNADGGSVTVEIVITANKSEGFSESTARAVRENSAQLDLDCKQS